MQKKEWLNAVFSDLQCTWWSSVPKVPMELPLTNSVSRKKRGMEETTEELVGRIFTFTICFG